MATRHKDVPRYSYLIAVVAGVCYTWFSFLVAASVSQLFDRWAHGLTFLGAVTFAAAHVIIGGLFGLLWPEKTWRWGVWLCLVPVFTASVMESEAVVFFGVVALTLAPACAGAYVAARVHLKYVDVE